METNKQTTTAIIIVILINHRMYGAIPLKFAIFHFIKLNGCPDHTRLCHTRFMDYDVAFFMHLTPEVVHNFPKAVGV